MRTPPLEVIESWPAPNYVDPETRGQSLLVVNITLLGLCLIALAARLWARLVILRAPGLDDLLITIAIIPTIGVAITVILATSEYGWNLHIWDVPISDIVPARKTAWVAQIFFILGTTCTKISILLFYRRLTSGALPKTFLYVIYANIAFISAYAIAFLFVLLVGCRPLDAYWYSALPTYTAEYSCYDEGAAATAAAIISVITDIVVVSLPCYVVLGMVMPIRQKLSLFVIFGVGLMVCIAGIIRTVYIWRTTNETYDETWIGYTLWLWTAVESDLAIICACTPALKPFFKRYLGGSVSENSKVMGTAGAYTRDTEAGKLTSVSGEIRLSSPKSCDIGGIVVTSELSVLERRVSETCTDDGCSAHRGYTSSVGSSQDLNGNRVDKGRSLKFAKQ